VSVDDWLTFKLKPKPAVLLRDLRDHLRKILVPFFSSPFPSFLLYLFHCLGMVCRVEKVQKIEQPEVDMSGIGESVVDAISKLLAAEQVGDMALSGTIK
jgi:hypothetical protein